MPKYGDNDKYTLFEYVYFILMWSVYYLLFLCLPSLQTHSLLFTLSCLSRLISTDYIIQVPIQWASPGLGQWEAPGHPNAATLLVAYDLLLYSTLPTSVQRATLLNALHLHYLSRILSSAGTLLLLSH